jgi:hypothetical protein
VALAKQNLSRNILAKRNSRRASLLKQFTMKSTIASNMSAYFKMGLYPGGSVK